ncbi:hypothetical protein ACFVGM_08720 [Kitasatospora purpeofusca]|uniref:hypothetical protein n=1 Tax=Kitasatospora purpeofusca TaxID=67352 RepID=UPI003690FD20
MPLRDDVRALIANVNKQFGTGSVVVASEIPSPARFPSGSLSLDVMLGGGWPANCWCEIVGSESSGKTTVVHKTIAANQDRDPEFTTLWIAAEAYDEDWARTLGVDTDRVVVHTTNAMEEAYEVMLQAAESRAVDAIVLDSYPALVAADEDEKKMAESTMATGARVTGRFFRKAGAYTKRSLVEDERPLLGIIINQWRDAIGAWAPPGTTAHTSPGGRAKNYAYSVRLEISRTEWIDEKRPPLGSFRVGQTIKLKTIKNKSAPPQQVATMRFFFADAPTLGFYQGDYDIGTDLIAMGLLHGVIDGPGKAYLSFGGRQWHGKPKLAASLLEEVDLQTELRAAVLAAAYPRAA